MKKRLLALVACLSILLSTTAMAGMTDDLVVDATAASNNVVVLIPGICGSELVNSAGTKIWVGLGSLTSQILCSESGVPSITLSPYNNDNYGTLDLYKTLYNNLKNRYSSEADVKFFAYDWRLGNTTAASRLKSLVAGYSGQIVLIAHSMGGLVVSDYLRQATSSQRSRTTFISLGTPFTGAPKAVQVMETGQMFPDIPTDYDTQYVQNLCRNMPAAYELLPTSRADAFLQVNGTDQTYANAWNVLKSRSWSKFTNGSGNKPMMANSVTFHNNQKQSNGTPYALAARNTVMISSYGYSTVAKVNYSLSNGTYSVASVVSTNNGDGTVPAYSGQNQMSNTDSHVVRLSSAGNHIGLVSNSTVYSRILQAASAGLAGVTLSAVQTPAEVEAVPTAVVNERGWIVGDDVDGRRIQVIARGVGEPKITTNDGKVCSKFGDDLFVDGTYIDGTYIGACWELSNDSYQIELMNDEYQIEIEPLSDNAEVEVSYMDSGYYENNAKYLIDNNNQTEYSINLDSFDKQKVAVSSVTGKLVEPIKVASLAALQAMNAD